MSGGGPLYPMMVAAPPNP